MNNIIIDADKCKKDGLCMEECPFGLFVDAGEGIPKMVEGYGKFCVNCGHCIAICPGDAITLNGLSSKDCDKINRKENPSTEQVVQMMRGRRSIRNFKDEPVKTETIEALIDMSRWAPTAKNFQPVHWLVVRERETIQSYSSHVIEWFKSMNIYPEVVQAFENGNDMINRKAPCLMIAHAHEQSLKPVEDCSIAAATVEAAAPTFGLGACWAGFFMAGASNYKPLMDELALPEGHKVYAALMLGVAKNRYNRIPPRQPAKIEWR